MDNIRIMNDLLNDPFKKILQVAQQSNNTPL